MGVALREGDTVRGAQFIIERPDEERRHVQSHPQPIRDLDGRLIGALDLLVDITDQAPASISDMAIDVADRQRVEKSLRESEQRFRTLASHAPVGIFQSGSDGSCIFVNECWCKMAGLTVEQARGDGWTMALHPDDREYLVDGWRRAVKSGTSSEVELRLLRPDGRITWILGNAVPLRNDNGQLAGYIGTAVDITERKVSEIALRESEHRFRHMADHAPVMIWVTEPDGRCTFLGKTWYEFTGLTPEASLGFGWIEAVHPEDRAAARDNFLAANHRHKPYALEYRLLHHDGDYRWTIDKAVPRFGQDGRFLGYIGSLIDISERRKAEEALRNSEQLYRAIGESIDFGVWTCDPEGRNTYASESFLKLVGLTQEQCSNYGWGDVLHPDDVEETISGWKNCVQTGGAWDIEHRFRGTDGKWHPVLARGVPVRNEQGEIMAWAGINLDISRLKQIEDELREADGRKDEFLALLAHELRNPLAPIRTGLELLRLAGDDRAVIEEVRLTMDRQSQQMVRLIDDLLDVSRITRGTVELRKGRVELAAVVESAVETARPVIEELEHELKIMLPERPVVLEADPTRLAQVISNLLNNAAKYMQRGGHINLSAEQQGGTVIISVKDFGIGITADMIDRIFDMFIQVDGSLERSHGGLGIGLTLVKRLVEMRRDAWRDRGSAQCGARPWKRVYCSAASGGRTAERSKQQLRTSPDGDRQTTRHGSRR